MKAYPGELTNMILEDCILDAYYPDLKDITWERQNVHISVCKRKRLVCYTAFFWRFIQTHKNPDKVKQQLNIPEGYNYMPPPYACELFNRMAPCYTISETYNITYDRNRASEFIDRAFTDLVDGIPVRVFIDDMEELISLAPQNIHIPQMKEIIEFNKMIDVKIAGMIIEDLQNFELNKPIEMYPMSYHIDGKKHEFTVSRKGMARNTELWNELQRQVQTLTIPLPFTIALTTTVKSHERVYKTISTPDQIFKYLDNAVTNDYDSNGDITQISVQTIKTSKSLQKLIANRNIKKQTAQGAGS